MSIQISKSSPSPHEHASLQVEEVSTPKSVNFGPGMEMFMNEKRSRPQSGASNKSREGGKGDHIDLNDLDDLDTFTSKNASSSKSRADSPLPMRIQVDDDDNASIGLSSLPDLSEDHGESSSSNHTKNIHTTSNAPPKKGGFMSLFGLGDKETNTVQKEGSNENDRYDEARTSMGGMGNMGGSSSLGKSTANVKDSAPSMPTFKDIPMHPDMDSRSIATKPKRTPEETVREKFKYLRKLEELEQKRGIKLTKHYSMESDLEEMIGEYEMIMSERERGNSVQFQGKMLMAAVTALEFLNNKVNPFDLQLDGWAESVNENLADYDDVFSELHEKYRGRANMAPELKLLFMLGGSATMLHMTNTMFKSAMPGIDDIMRQNPDLMQQFSKAVSSSMGQQNPGFDKFVNGVMGDGGGGGGAGFQGPQGYQGSQGPQGREYPKEPALPKYDRAPEQSASARVMEARKEQRQQAQRTEMKGPSDLGDILQRLKPKGGLGQMNFQRSAPQAPRQAQQPQQSRPPSRPQPQTQQAMSRVPQRAPIPNRQAPQSQRPQPSQPSQPSQQSQRPQAPTGNGFNPFSNDLEAVDISAPPRSQRSQRKEEQRSTISIQELKERQTNESGRRRKSERNTISLDV